MEEEMRKALTGWSLRPVVEGLMALRGVSLDNSDDGSG